MNQVHVLRIVWKDYRRMAGLGIALLLFWLLCLVAWTFFSGRTEFPLALPQVAVLIMATGVVHALCWAGLTFAVEHEDKTYDFLRSLPVSPRSVFWGKISYGAASTILLVAILAALCYLHLSLLRAWGGGYATNRRISTWELESFGLSMLAASSVWAISIGAFWSMRIKKPFYALAIGALFVVVVPQAAILISGIAFPNSFIQDAQFYSRERIWSVALSVAITLGASALMMIANLKSCHTWLPNYQTLGLPSSGLRSPGLSSPVVRPPSSAGRLFWLGWKQNWLVCLMLGIVGVCLAATGATVLTVGAAGLLGVLAFRADHQENRYRLLSQFGANRTIFWLSRLWLPALTCVMMAVACLATMVNGYASGPFAWSLTLSVIAAFCVGQFCSMAFKSAIIATAMTLIATIVLSSWLYLCIRLGVPSWLSIVPMLILPLLASYLRIPRWFQDTGSWKQWVIPAIPILLLFTAVPFATAYYRMYEIPSVDLPIAALPQRSPEEEAKLDEWRALLSSVSPSSDSQSLDTTVQLLLASGVDQAYGPETLNRLVNATKGATAFPQPLSYLSRRTGVSYAIPSMGICAAFLAKAHELQSQGSPSEAWEHYAAALRLVQQQNDLYSGKFGQYYSQQLENGIYPKLLAWAAQEKTTAEQIESAVAAIDELVASKPIPRESIRGDYTNTVRWLEDPTRLSGQMSPAERKLLDFLSLAPWEIERAKRFRDYSFANVLSGVDRTREAALSYTTPLSAYVSCPDLFLSENKSKLAAGTICQLLAVAQRKRIGDYDYKTDFESLARNLSQPIRDQIVRMQLVNDSELGPCIVNAQYYPVDREAMSTDGTADDFRLFLLPYGDWHALRFQERTFLGSEAHQAALYAGDPSTLGYGQGDDMSAGGFDPDPYGFAMTTNTQASADATAEAFADVFAAVFRASPGKARIAIRELLAEILSSDDERQVRVLLDQLTSHYPGVTTLLSEQLVTLLESEDAGVAGRAAIVLRQCLRNGELSEEQIHGFADHSASKLTNHHSTFGFPIRNPENGHYYELIEGYPNLQDLFTTRWKGANRFAHARVFKGIHGHLVTISSKAEFDFIDSELIAPLTAMAETLDIEEASQMRAWTGGKLSDDETDDDTWVWGSGPENGKPIDLSITEWKQRNPKEGQSHLALEFADGKATTWVSVDTPLGAWLLIEYSTESNVTDRDNIDAEEEPELEEGE